MGHGMVCLCVCVCVCLCCVKLSKELYETIFRLVRECIVLPWSGSNILLRNVGTYDLYRCVGRHVLEGRNL